MMINATRNLCLLALLVGVGLVMVGSVVDAYPASSINDYDDYFLNRRDQQIQDDELMRELYARVGNTIHFQRGSPKRTVDFGFARGFSGTQEAKHRLGLAAANYAGGPGRKRRSDDSWSRQQPASVVADETA